MRKIIVGNWKMLLSAEEACALGKTLSHSSVSPEIAAILCPPFPVIASVGALLTSSPFKLGAQDCSPFSKGAHTGDVSPSLLKDMGCSYVIVGHSERRQMYGETNALVRQKAENAMSAGLTPIICIGESHEVNAAHQTIPFLKAQLAESCPPKGGCYIFAYEPIWAIGTGRTPNPKDIDLIHASLKELLTDATPLLYGGSVAPHNVGSFLSLPTVDGVLVGGASTNALQFKDILNASL